MIPFPLASRLNEEEGDFLLGSKTKRWKAIRTSEKTCQNCESGALCAYYGFYHEENKNWAEY